MLVERGSDRLLICSLFNYLGYSVSVEPGIYRRRVRAKARSEKKEEAETLFLDILLPPPQCIFMYRLFLGNEEKECSLYRSLAIWKLITMIWLLYHSRVKVTIHDTMMMTTMLIWMP
jgi:hypothetical protein